MHRYVDMPQLCVYSEHHCRDFKRFLGREPSHRLGTAGVAVGYRNRAARLLRVAAALNVQ